MVYKIQFCNANTQEILREQSYDKPDRVEKMVNDLSNAIGEVYLMDSEKRMHVANYVSHKAVETDRYIIYKVFFKMKLCEMQPMVKL